MHKVTECKIHPQYLGIHKPQVMCASCWDVYKTQLQMGVNGGKRPRKEFLKHTQSADFSASARTAEYEGVGDRARGDGGKIHRHGGCE